MRSTAARPEPLRVQLERELRDAIRSGRLAAGERLPSSRAMAAGLGISRGLVIECYSQLQAEGFLTSRAGSATRVAAGALATPSPSTSRTPDPEPTGPVPSPRFAVDFCPGVPDLTSFPRRDWAWAMRDSCRNATPRELGYGDPRGTEALREVLAGYLRRVRGTVADAERIVICGGFGQGINLVLRSLAADGIRRVAIEDPGDDDYLEISARLGIEAVPVPIDERGIDVEALAATGVARGDPHSHSSVPDRHRAGSGAPPGAGQPGPASGTPRSSRTTTTPSSATTATRSARSRGWLPSGSR